MTAAIALKRINHVELRSRDLARSATFYRELFGLVPRRDDSSPEKLLLAPEPQDGGDGFGLYLAQGLPAGTELAGLDHISLEVDGIDAVNALHERAAQLGATATRPRDVNGHYQFYVFDPDGYKVEVLAHRDPPDG